MKIMNVKIKYHSKNIKKKIIITINRYYVTTNKNVIY